MWWTQVARQRVEPRLPMHGLRDWSGTWVYGTYRVKRAQGETVMSKVIDLASRRRQTR